MTESIVHGLEVVEIDEQNSGSSTAANCSLKRVLHTIPEQHSICEIGERIVKRLMSELLLELLALRNVVKDGENSSTYIVSNRHRSHFHIEHARIVHAAELTFACGGARRGADQ